MMSGKFSGRRMTGLVADLRNSKVGGVMQVHTGANTKSTRLGAGGFVGIRGASIAAAIGVGTMLLSGCTVLTGITPPTGSPSVSSVSPDYGSQAGGSQVVIDGSGFTGATSVSFGSTPATSFSVISDSEIKATAPSSSAANGVEVDVSNSSGSSTKVCLPIIQLPGCSGASFFYMSNTPWNVSTPVNINNVSVPIPGVSGASILVSATGGNLNVNGSMGDSVDAGFIPTAFIANGTVSISNLTVTFSGQISAPVEVPLPLGLPYGLAVYVTVDPSLTVPIPVSLVLNASWTFAGGFINGGLSPMSSTLTCQGVNINSLPTAFGTCINAAATAPSLNGLNASLITSPFWLQVGPPGLDAAIGPQVGLSAGVDSSSGASYWEICAGLGWAIQASILSRSGNLLGPYTIDSSTTGNPGSHCPMGAAS